MLSATSRRCKIPTRNLKGDWRARTIAASKNKHKERCKSAMHPRERHDGLWQDPRVTAKAPKIDRKSRFIRKTNNPFAVLLKELHSPLPIKKNEMSMGRRISRNIRLNMQTSRPKVTFAPTESKREIVTDSNDGGNQTTNATTKLRQERVLSDVTPCILPGCVKMAKQGHEACCKEHWKLWRQIVKKTGPDGDSVVQETNNVGEVNENKHGVRRPREAKCPMFMVKIPGRLGPALVLADHVYFFHFQNVPKIGP